MITWNDLTEKQKAIYKSFPFSGFLGDELIDEPCYDTIRIPYDCRDWADLNEMTTKQVRAIITTLVNTDLIFVSDKSCDRIRWIGFTKNGYDLLKNVVDESYYRYFE